jgi:hypothetical protein
MKLENSYIYCAIISGKDPIYIMLSTIVTNNNTAVSGESRVGEQFHQNQ